MGYFLPAMGINCCSRLPVMLAIGCGGLNEKEAPLNKGVVSESTTAMNTTAAIGVGNADNQAFQTVDTAGIRCPYPL